MSQVARPNIAPAPREHAPKRMVLSAVSRGRLEKPMRVLLYGVEGIGKSTFAAAAPSPIFIGAEDGTAQLDVSRFPEPRSWQDVLDAIETLRQDEHDFKTLVIDTLDWAEPMCWEHVCKRGGKPDIESFGYGKGYNAALDEWRTLISRLGTLRSAKGMHIVCVAHCWIKSFKNPAGDDFDRYELKIHSKAGGLLKEWHDAVLFATYETLTHEKDGKVKGVSTGARMVHSTRTAAWDAKNRYGLPETFPLSWSDFVESVNAGAPADPDRLRLMIERLIPELSESLAAKTAGALERAGGDGTKLAHLLDWARGRRMIEQSPKEEAIS